VDFEKKHFFPFFEGRSLETQEKVFFSKDPELKMRKSGKLEKI